ncbi:DNA polymerase III subunit chi [Pseudomonas sp. TKO26]|uniref:DNA polymerase III subunit chi n=1 Tax=unclassified Pseudomonas TaxID=196821 RepID=UPI000D848E54|nr:MULTISPECIES: DNA polymerase III subunit chi [unclassified Pseudomonas]PYY90702.1 DNA polymerase III subunit chi [Pseudomonas sp. TKO30]PYY93574.1 DNA polymerase III subunit chi [Pseudomonas sp. TKO29]PYY95802.1 DNA polymerase III subunit chi [Pseudomonas sp. TKO26]PYZ01733.1 DNA polymerase III subunit chi [Pseudomonas sp. TKO14]
MDTPNPLQKPAHLLDDLESIRKLLGDDNLQPPLLTETVSSEVQIPLLFDMVGSQQPATTETAPAAPAKPQPAPAPAQVAAPAPTPAPPPAPASTPAAKPAAAAASNSADALLHLDTELRAAAQLIMQDVIDDFAPHIETEIKRRLDARLERLLAAATNGKP